MARAGHVFVCFGWLGEGRPGEGVISVSGECEGEVNWWLMATVCRCIDHCGEEPVVVVGWLQDAMIQ
jgi:hypothetical protein